MIQGLETRVAPNSLDAEVAVLGAVLLDNDTLAVLTDVTPEMFYRESHRRIWQAMKNIESRGGDNPIDLVTLSEELRTRGQLDEIGGATYLIGLSESVPTAVYAEYYARILKEKHALRQLIHNSGRIMQMAYESELPVDEIQDRAQQLIYDVTSQETVEADSADGEQAVGLFMEWLEGNKGQPFATGLKDVDEMLGGGLYPESLIVLGAPPRVGKSTFALNVADRIAESYKDEYDALYFAMEMSADEITSRRVAARARVDFQRLRAYKQDPKNNPLTEQDWTRISKALETIRQVPLTIYDRPGMSYNYIASKARAHMRKRGKKLSLVVVDYLQIMDFSAFSKAGSNESSEIGKTANAFKRLARELQCPIMVVSSLSRDVEKRPNHRPMLSDLRASGDIEYAAKEIFFLYRDEIYNPDTDQQGIAEFIIGKQRNGPVGVVKLQFHGAQMRFNSLATGN
ncbi:replicative DNA helicase [Deinococcus cellulosilyticus]|uniref:DNA 5'-3' helicase n=1 Tax=Deinococcus cellulosilyticus (strain DSM 18568 / NBRC 106333 / KACC 11606 / 5516J-15) TaxID=1223518 RepID=A0A511N7A4_DEIC1|nr:replicative DNA helicase [Deinococcus cellulosilyticus]GEM48725.1 replicative DNA helicase [Deinococcus cellulosilyticus NBRC 106333 = KACC 11606]